VGPEKSLLAATGFTRQPVGIRLSCGSSTIAVGRALTTIRLNDSDHGMRGCWLRLLCGR